MRHLPSVILLIPAAREFDRGLRRGIVEYGKNHGPWTFYEEVPAYLHGLTPSQRLRSMRAWKADGVILLQDRLAEVKPLGIPMVVSIGTRRLGKGYTEIVCDNEAIGKLGATTLLGLGLRHFGYCGLSGLEFSDHRAASFLRTIESAGREAHHYSHQASHPERSWYDEQKQLARWLGGLPKPAGILACNDDRARMLSEVCHLRGIRIPDDVAILGVDNDEQVCSSANPPLSSIALATERGGYAAAALLDALMRGRNTTAELVAVSPTHVVSRQSTDTLAIDDPILVRSLRFIRDNSDKAIRVADLRSVAWVSRRALQDRFKHFLGRTPMEEIHRCRLERIQRLLIETDMTVGEIAMALGFDVDAHFSRFFSRQTGITPREYRRKNRVRIPVRVGHYSGPPGTVDSVTGMPAP